MSLNVNEVRIAGRLTHDPEMRMTQSGIPVCSFSVAVNRRVKKDEEQKADFFDVTVWRETAQFVSQYFRKGDAIYVAGSMLVDDYEKDGQKRRSWKVVAHDVEFVESKSSKASGQQADAQDKPSAALPAAQAAEEQPVFTVLGPDDDLPF